MLDCVPVVSGLAGTVDDGVDQPEGRLFRERLGRTSLLCHDRPERMLRFVGLHAG
jgi:hypothetical protein